VNDSHNKPRRTRPLVVTVVTNWTNASLYLHFEAEFPNAFLIILRLQWC